VLVEYYIRNFKTGFLITIQYLNAYANELLKVRDSDKTVSYYCYNSFFKRYPAIKSKFSRPINRKRMNAEDSDEFIDFFQRFINVKNEWGIVDSNIYNMDKLGSVIDLEQNSKVIIFSEKR
jgi:hypothetical protein